jgi:BirA family transcriptional regulator, biotin operon repressor / biotin---[acetyl-CoA-carboxylase] ligase
MIDLEELQRNFPDRELRYYSSIDSTMRAAAGLPLRSIVLADEQTAGQGRHGHTWHSEPSNGIYCSIVLEPAPLLTLAIGIATVEAIAHSCDIVCDLRWPNDLLLDGRKVAGILVQLTGSQAVAGIGINVNHTLFPPELEREATSLCIHNKGRRFSRERILTTLIPAIESIAGEDKETILALFTRASSYVAGRRVTVSAPEGRIVGTTAGLNSDGYLIVRRDDGTESLILAGGVRATGS